MYIQSIKHIKTDHGTAIIYTYIQQSTVTTSEAMTYRRPTITQG